jgi:DNA ligase-1
MSKRGPSASASPSKNKRSKMQHTQSHIDHFFSSSALKAKIEGLHHSHLIQGTSPGRSVQKDVNGPEVIDVDVGVAPAEPFNSPELESTPSAGPSGIVLQKTFENKPTSPLVFGPLDVDPIAYGPQSQPSMSEAPFGLLTHAFVTLSQTRSRIAILNILTNVLRTIIHKYPSSLLPSVYLLSNSLKPQFIPVELGLGSSIISRAIQQISGLSSTALRKLYNSTGDPGDVAFAAKSNLRTLVPHPPLTIPYVYESLLKVAGCKGLGAAKDKQKIVEKLLLASSGEEVRYLTRTLCQNLRVGAVRTSILTALARAIVLTPPEGVTKQIINCDKQSPHVTTPTKSSTSKGKRREVEQDDLVAVFKQAESLMKQVYAKHPNFDQIIAALLEEGLDSLAERVPLTVGLYFLWIPILI